MEEKNKKQKVALARFAHSRRRRHADASDVCAAAQHIFFRSFFVSENVNATHRARRQWLMLLVRAAPLPEHTESKVTNTRICTRSRPDHSPKDHQVD